MNRRLYQGCSRSCFSKHDMIMRNENVWHEKQQQHSNDLRNVQWTNVPRYVWTSSLLPKPSFSESMNYFHASMQENGFLTFQVIGKCLSSLIYLYFLINKKPDFFLFSRVLEFARMNKRWKLFSVFFFSFSLQQEELLNELKGRKEAIKDQKLIKREALTDGTIETLLDGKEDEMIFECFDLLFFMINRSEENAIFTCRCSTTKSTENPRINETNQSRYSNRKQSSSTDWSSLLILGQGVVDEKKFFQSDAP